MGTECYLTRYPDIYEGARALRLPRTVPRSRRVARAQASATAPSAACTKVRVGAILEHMAVAGQEEGRDESACATKCAAPA